MNVYELDKITTPKPWGSVAGVVTCADDGEHIGSFHSNTLAFSVDGRHLMRGPASAAWAAHCSNNFMRMLAALRDAESSLADEYPSTDCRHPRQSGLSALIVELESIP